MRRVVLVVVLGSCGRIGFDALDPRHDAPPAMFDGQLSFDAPMACAAYAAPPSCSAASPNVTLLHVSTLATCALRGTNRLECWGRNDEGELGFCTTTTQVLAPTDTYGFEIAQIIMGEQHTCVRLTDGQLWCWGSSYEGESGNGIYAMPDPIAHRVGVTWRDVSSRRYFTCGVASDRSLWCWGHNDEGQLGLGDTTDRGFPTRVGTDTDWDTVACGGTQTCAVKTTGEAYCWGLNGNGEIGDGSTQQRLAPVPVMTATRFKQLAVGKAHSCGLDAAGGLWCWGLGASGQLGNGGISDGLVPQQVPGSYASAAAGNYHTCAIEATNHLLYCWGDNGELTLVPDSMVAYIATPSQFPGGPYAEVAAGGYTTCVRQTDGAVFCFGDNGQGQLGNGNTTTTTTYQSLCFPN